MNQKVFKWGLGFMICGDGNMGGLELSHFPSDAVAARALLTQQSEKILYSRTVGGYLLSLRTIPDSAHLTIGVYVGSNSGMRQVTREMLEKDGALQVAVEQLHRDYRGGRG